MTEMHWGRKVVIVLGVAFLLSGGWFLFQGWKGNRKFHAWQSAVSTRMPLNLREPGWYVGAYTQTCSSAHGTALELQTGVTNADSALENLAGVVVIRDKQAVEVLRESFAGRDIGSSWLRGQVEVPALRLGRFPCGQYQMEVTITQGAKDLTTTNHLIVGRYILCGLERMPFAILSILGWLLMFFASICAVITYRYLRLRRKMK
jgi:hypothetical protein